MNTAAFIVISILTLAAALAAATLPKLIHAALCFAVAFVGIAAFFFLLGAEFVGLVQIFVYVGAVAVLIVFTILFTRRDVEKDRGFNWGGVVIAIAVFGGLIWAILKTPALSVAAAANVEALTVKQIGEVLMTDYVWPLQCVGLLLTAALIGAIILVMEEKRDDAPTLQLFLIVSPRRLFCIGLLAALSRRHAIFILDRHRDDARRGEPEFHRVLALRLRNRNHRPA